MNIVYRHGYYGDREVFLHSLFPSICCDWVELKLQCSSEEWGEETLYAVSYYYENGKLVFDCPENY